MAKQTTAPARPVTRRTNTARKTAGSGRKARAAESTVHWSIPFDRTNLILLIGGVVAIVIGYFLMSTAISGVWNNDSAVIYAPLILVIGYCIIVPIAIMRRSKSNAAESESASGANE